MSEPDVYKVIIEIEKGSNRKFEYDEKTKDLRLDFVFENLVFPFNYGFVPNSLGGDGDPLDAIVISSGILKPLSEIECKVIGILNTIDRDELDDKVVCVPVEDPLAKQYDDVSDLPPDTFEKWKDFYTEVARQKNKQMDVIGFKNKREAIEEVEEAIIK